MKTSDLYIKLVILYVEISVNKKISHKNTIKNFY